MILWLVGMMGSGKSTIGRIVAETLHVRFYDTDTVIESRHGADVPAIWESGGERRFRRLESAVVATLSKVGCGVVATGGGAVLDPWNRERMRATGRVVWLRAGNGHLARNLGETDGRPLLDSSTDRRATLGRLGASRACIYLDLADQVVDVDRRTPRSVAREIGASWSS